MDKINFENLPSTNTPISAENLNQLQENIENAILTTMQLMFPVGSSYITQEDINPSEILGFGTWERTKGKVFVGLDEDDTNFNAVGKTGGEKTHTLTVDEMPSHNHRIYRATSGQDGGSDWNVADSFGGVEQWYTSNAGGDQPHNNLQPYEVVGYMWIRRA